MVLLVLLVLLVHGLRRRRGVAVGRHWQWPRYRGHMVRMLLGILEWLLVLQRVVLVLLLLLMMVLVLMLVFVLLLLMRMLLMLVAVMLLMVRRLRIGMVPGASLDAPIVR